MSLTIGESQMNEYEQIKTYIRRFKNGVIDYETLEILTKPFIDNINRKNKDIALKHGMKPKTVYLRSIMRNTY
jgi:hypothetical protein